MEVVGETENGQRAVALACELVPYVILMDVKMPVMHGAEATKQILAVMPILKGCEPEDLYSAIRKVKPPDMQEMCLRERHLF